MGKSDKRAAQKSKQKPVAKPQVSIINRPWFWPALIALVSLFAYANTLNHDFVLDDYSVIADNRIVQQGTSGMGEIFSTHYREGAGSKIGTLYRPFTLAVFAITWQASAGDPSTFHLINLLFYALLCVVLFLLLAQLHIPRMVAAGAALLFALHPLHTEVVANIKSLDEILSVLGVIGAWWLLERGEYKKPMNLALAGALMLMAFFSKEGVATFLFILPAWLYFRKLPLRQWIAPMLVILVPFAIYMIARANVLDGSNISLTVSRLDNPLMKLSGVEYYLTAMKVLGMYLYKSLIPFPLIYEMAYNSIEPSGFGDWKALVSLLVYVGIGAAALYYTLKRKVVGFWLLFFLISLSIYSNLIVQIGSIYGERFLFWPSVAVCILVAWGIYEGITRMKASNMVYFVVVGLMGTVFFGITRDRNGDWENNFTLYESNMDELENSAKAHYNYGLELMKFKALNSQRKEERNRFLRLAVNEFGRAAEISPGYADAYGELGLAHFRLNENETAVTYFEKSVELNPKKPQTWNNMAIIHFNRGDFARAAECYEKAVALSPYYTSAWGNLGACYGSMGQHEKAINAFLKAIEIKPDYAQCYQYAALSYQALGQEEMAQRYFSQARALNPNLGK